MVATASLVAKRRARADVGWTAVWQGGGNACLKEQRLGLAMTDVLHLTLSNAILPLTALLLLVVGLPAMIARQTLSQGTLAVAILLTAAVVWAAGAVVMAWLYAAINDGVFPGVGASLERSGLLVLLWGPVLALVWLLRAQGVERRRGLLMGRGGDEAVD
jgi:hypothetical protein